MPERDMKSVRNDALRSVRTDLILNAAETIFAADGFDKATMRRIASEAGCTTGAIYPLFPSKEDIYAGLLMRSLDALLDRTTHFAKEAAPGWSRIDAASKAFVDFYVNRPAELALGLYLFSAGIGWRGISEGLDKELNSQLWSSLKWIEQGISETTGATEVNPRIETMTLFSGLSGALVLHHTGRLKTFGQTIDDVVDRQLSILRMALETRPDTIHSGATNAPT